MTYDNPSKTYAYLILPYNPVKKDVMTSAKDKEKLGGKLKSAFNSIKQRGLKNSILNPDDSLKDLGKYLQNTGDVIANKFSGIAMAQLLADGKITNKNAMDYLFLGALPALNQTYSALGYSGVQQMKNALMNGSINVGAFVNGFSKFLKAGIDLKNKVLNIDSFNGQNVIIIDVTYAHQETYMSESGDRRVEAGISWNEFIHNLPETFSLNCGIQDGKRYSVYEFKQMLTNLRQRKIPFQIVIDEELTENVILQNFTPTREGATNGLEYTLELKKAHVSTIEYTPITIQALPKSVTESTATSKGSSSATVGGAPKIADYKDNPFDEIKKIMKNKKRSWPKMLFDPK